MFAEINIYIGKKINIFKAYIGKLSKKAYELFFVIEERIFSSLFTN